MLKDGPVKVVTDCKVPPAPNVHTKKVLVLKVKKDDPETTFEAWIRVNVTVRLMLLFILPSEMGLESGGFRLAETLHERMWTN